VTSPLTRGEAGALVLEHVTRRYEGNAEPAVDDLSLSVAPGELLALVGASGSGKTTTLRIVAGYEVPDSGRVLLTEPDGARRDLTREPPQRRGFGMVFQHYALFPHMDVARNVGYGLRQTKVGKAEEGRRVGEALAMVRLAGYERRRTWEMSGGQQQRVALARALVNHPTVLLLDEPLGALDLKLRKEMQLELKALQREVGITFVYVTHDQEEALTMSDVIVVMRDGLIQQMGGPTELYERPVNRFVADFIGTSNFVDASVLEANGEGGHTTVRTDRGLVLRGRVTDRTITLAVGDSVTVVTRPERLEVLAADSAGEAPPGSTQVEGRIHQGTYLGDQTEYRVATERLGELIVRHQNAAGARGALGAGPGDRVIVRWNEDANLVLAG
jgi:spermidine/putrescine transport system ATP-binding protein